MPETPPSGAVSVRYQASDTRLLVGLGLAGVGAYLGYRYVYLPWRVQQDYNAQVAAYQRQHGVSRADALAVVGAQACQVIAAGYGVPPQRSGAMCQVAGGAAAEIARALPGAVVGTARDIGGSLLSTGASLGQTALTVARTPVNILGGPIKPMDFVVFPVGVTKLTTKGVALGAKGVAAGAKAVGKFLGKIF